MREFIHSLVSNLVRGDVNRIRRSVGHPTPYTLHPTPYTLHPLPYTLHPTPSTLHPTPSTLHLLVHGPLPEQAREAPHDSGHVLSPKLARDLLAPAGTNMLTLMI